MTHPSPQGPRPEVTEAVRQLWQREELILAPYATHTAQTLGRVHAEKQHPCRTDFMRDRDRIIHCAAFRRLLYKTQVFICQPVDHQRTRLTHTLEVAQIARTVARNLRLNEDLTEAIALAHDLGHPPFGHAGERALAVLLADHGGFEHNRHGLRLLEWLEGRYPNFAGLNLTYEVLETMRFRARKGKRGPLEGPDGLVRQAMLPEGQVVDACDSIAYVAHDLDDALRAGLIGFADLRDLELWRQVEAHLAEGRARPLEGKWLARATIRTLIDWMTSSLLRESARRLASFSSPQAIQQAETPVIALEPDLDTLKKGLADFLFQRVYRAPTVVKTTHVAEGMVSRLFAELLRDPSPMPAKYLRRLNDAGEIPQQVVGDYVAGMTDRFAQMLHRQLFEPC